MDGADTRGAVERLPAPLKERYGAMVIMRCGIAVLRRAKEHNLVAPDILK